MAKPRKTKAPTTKRRDDFYEAVPASLTPPAALPSARESAIEGARVFQSLLTSSIARLTSFHRPQLSTIARRFSATSLNIARFAAVSIIWIGQTATSSFMSATRAGLGVARSGAGFTAEYVPSAVADARAATFRFGRSITSRRARTVYLYLIIGGLFSLAVVGSVTAVSTINAYAKAISSPAALLANKKTGITILDRNGKVLFQGYGAQNTVVEPFSDMPKTLVDATLSAEDPSFYTYSAISVKATLRAAWADITHGSAVQGGSTLTQQLVKNALLNDNKTIVRKYEEVILSLDLAQKYSKNEIMDMYLNEIYYGEGASGVQAAAETYFHTSAHNLTLGESALIAGLPLGPSRFDPNFDLSAATGRRNYVLGRMAQLGYITQAQAAAAEAQPLQLAAPGAAVTAAPGSNPMIVYAKDTTVQAPWFVFYVLDQLRSTYGDQLVEQGGLTVRTTLNLNLEQDAENDIQSQISTLAANNVTNGALIALAPKTGDILAMVGSVNYNAPSFGNVNVTLSTRQPGSSWKPITYATAFEKGWNGATTVEDEPISFPQANGTTYTPQNYDLQFHGLVTLRHALDNSLNIPALKVQQFAGVPATLQTAKNMGITTLGNTSQYGLSLALGSADVRPIDMATVYSTLDNLGQKVMPKSILEVTNREGQNITKNTQPAPTQVLNPDIAYMLTNIMADNQSREPEFPLGGPLMLSGNRPAAAKTGTTNDFRDNWTIGYTPQIVTTVWVGNNNNTPMQDVDGYTGAAPIWHDFMEQALAGQPVEPFPVPAGVTFANVCESNGGLTSAGQAGYPEVFLTGHVTTTQCNETPGSSAYTTAADQPSVASSSSSSSNPTTTSSATPTVTPNPVPTPSPVPTPTPPLQTSAPLPQTDPEPLAFP